MLPKKKKAVSSAEKAAEPEKAEEPIAGTSTGGQTVQVMQSFVWQNPMFSLAIYGVKVFQIIKGL